MATRKEMEIKEMLISAGFNPTNSEVEAVADYHDKHPTLTPVDIYREILGEREPRFSGLKSAADMERAPRTKSYREEGRIEIYTYLEKKTKRTQLTGVHITSPHFPTVPNSLFSGELINEKNPTIIPAPEGTYYLQAMIPYKEAAELGVVKNTIVSPPIHVKNGKASKAPFVFVSEHGGRGGGGNIDFHPHVEGGSVGDIRTGDVSVNVGEKSLAGGFGEIHGTVYHNPPASTLLETNSKRLGRPVVRRAGVHGCYIYLEGTDIEWSFHTQADVYGYYRIRKIPPGNYTIWVEPPDPEYYEDGPNKGLAPLGYYPIEPKQIEVKPNEDKEYDFEMNRIYPPPRKMPKPGYHVISSKRSHWKKIFGASIGGPRLWPYKRTHECQGCGKKTLVEERDEKTGQIYYRCANKDCPDFLSGKRLTPDDIEIKGRKTPFLGLNAREKANKRLVWEDRMRELRAKYKRDEITEEEFVEEKKKINMEIYGKEDKKGGGLGAVTRVGGPLAQLSSHAGEEVRKGIFAASIIGIGAVIASLFGNWWFFMGFLSAGLYILTPSPSFGKFEEGQMGWGHIMPWAQGGTHAGYAWIKSITKVSMIICFAYGFKTMGDIFNIFFVITCLIGYFSLAVKYDSDKPGQFIESLLRFGVLGCYFIPLYVFASIFNSYVLAAIAFAFFAIPPMPSTKNEKNLVQVLAQGLSGQTAYYEMFDKLLFIFLMGFALVASGSLGTIPLVGSFLNVGWQLTGTLKATFIYFWVIALIGGFFSPASERPLTGIIFLGGATVIYAVGPGSQDIGSALLGQWWPTVNQSVMAVAEPISAMFGQMGKTFGDAFTLLTCPTCYATQLMNGTYQNNGVGPTGAYGVELSNWDVTTVFIGQPFMITANIKNNGAYNAQNIRIALSAGLKSPEQRGMVLTQTLGVPGSYLSLTQLGIKGCESLDKTTYLTKDDCELKCKAKCDGMKQDCGSWDCVPSVLSETEYNFICTIIGSSIEGSTLCVHYYGKENPGMVNFTRLNTWATTFTSSGINCSVSKDYELRKKSIPINVTVSYSYESDSKVPVEFISEAEWNRLANNDQLDSTLKLVTSQYSVGPVKFPIGTPGLKNPILETQDFHIALTLTSDQEGGSIDGVESIVLNYPKEFTLASDGCFPGGDGNKIDAKTLGVVRWTKLDAGDKMLFCHFLPLKGKDKEKSWDLLKGSPTKSYIITAHAKYNYSNSKQKLVKVEFGSWCCVGESGTCADTYTCKEEAGLGGRGICVPSGQGGTGSGSCIQPSASDIASYISQASTTYAVNPSIIKAIIMQESEFKHCVNGAYNERVETNGNSRGIMQMRQIAVDDVLRTMKLTVNVNDAQQNILGGTAYFASMTASSGYANYNLDSLELRLAAYNAGPGSINNLLEAAKNSGKSRTWDSIKDSAPSITKSYVPAAVAYYSCYEKLNVAGGCMGPITKSAQLISDPNSCKCLST